MGRLRSGINKMLVIVLADLSTARHAAAGWHTPYASGKTVAGIASAVGKYVELFGID